jgi:SAM-dependent methyltransferase
MIGANDQSTMSVVDVMQCDESSEDIRPFEWLTSPSSLGVRIREALEGSVKADGDGSHVLHVGCGSSALGEYLLENSTLYGISRVINVDKDVSTLRRMRSRWKKKNAGLDDCRLQYEQVDLLTEKTKCESNTIDLVIDKSTLDCTLCSDETTASLLTEVYRLLKANGGVYLLVSFHNVGLLQPLLENCPGTDWDVSHSVMMRQVEDLTSRDTRCISPQKASRMESSTAWTESSCTPDEMYRKTVNVFFCRRRPSGDHTHELDRTSVSHHVNETSNKWYRDESPMLTEQRKMDLRNAFGDGTLDLESCYRMVFSEEERDHLDFEFFLDDWKSFCERGISVGSDHMDYATAVAFLEEMQ